MIQGSRVRTVQTLLALITAAILAACDERPTGGSSINIAGTWNFSYDVSSSSFAASCRSHGTVTITQTGSSFWGNGNDGIKVCSQNGAIVSNESGLSAAFSGGINGTSVSFADDGGCGYSGTISGSPPNRLSGNATCTILVGTWEATR